YVMFLSGEPISGQEAAVLGLANHVVHEEDDIKEALKLANKSAEISQPAISHIMQLITFAKTGQFSRGVQEEAKAFGDVFGSEDAKEGIQAFIEKRKPQFKDK